MAPKYVHVASFGEILWDCFLRGATSGAEGRPRDASGAEGRPRDASGAEGRPRDAAVFDRRLGGAPANLATVCARLGLASRVVGAVGRDVFGRELKALLHREGVDVRCITMREERTGLAFVLRDARGQPSFLFYRDRTADVSIEADDVHAAAANARFAVIGSSTLQTAKLRAATRAFVESAEHHGADLVLDLNVRPGVWSSAHAMNDVIAKFCKRARVVKASSEDLRALGSRGDSFLATFAPHAVWLVTDGPRPARIRTPACTVRGAPRQATCRDATGAGDAFLAGALAVLSKWPTLAAVANDEGALALALEVGNSLGSRAVTREGAVTALSRVARERKLLKYAGPAARSTRGKRA